MILSLVGSSPVRERDLDVRRHAPPLKPLAIEPHV
jgi:hypothetical protein